MNSYEFENIYNILFRQNIPPYVTVYSAKFAVVLKYIQNHMDAPSVVRKNKLLSDYKGDPLMYSIKNDSLADKLYLVELDDEIPFELYADTAEMYAEMYNNMHDFKFNVRCSLPQYYKNGKTDSGKIQKIIDASPQHIVVTDNKNYAVILRYTSPAMDAPIVADKGIGGEAVQILELAQEKKLLIYENKTMAEELYDDVNTGCAIPCKHRQEIGYLYKNNGVIFSILSIQNYTYYT